MMSVRFSSPLRTFSPEDRFSPGNGPGQGASEFSASECPGEWQMADAGIPDTAKGRCSIFQLREKTGGCSPCLALLAPASQPPGSPPASTRFAYTESAETPPEPISLHLHCCVSPVFRQVHPSRCTSHSQPPNATSGVKSGWERKPVPAAEGP